MPKKETWRVNEAIRAERLLVVKEGDSLGEMSRRAAINLADEAGLDLVEMVPHATPPVARIMDYGKFRFEQSKRDRQMRSASRGTVIAEVRLRPRIGQHDLEVKARQARRLLGEGKRVKALVRFRAREISHPEVGTGVLERFVGLLDDVGQVVSASRLQGRVMTLEIAARG